MCPAYRMPATEYVEPFRATEALTLLDVLAEVIEDHTRHYTLRGGTAQDDQCSPYDWRDYIVTLAECLGEEPDELLHNRERLIAIASLAITAVQSLDRREKSCTTS